MYFRNIKKSEHYIKEHERFVPWSEVVNIILTIKQKRKKDDKIEIETNIYYVLCELKDQTLGVINAKRKGQ